jgi:hypothetical protein
MKTPNEDVTKLPKWARDRIQHLEGVIEWERKRADAVAPRTHAHIEALHVRGMVTYGHAMMKDERALPLHESVYFWTGPGSQDYMQVSHDSHLNDEAIVVRSGMMTLVVQPQSGNSIIVENVDLPAFTRRRQRQVQDRIDKGLCQSCGMPAFAPSRTGCRAKSHAKP